MVLTGETLKDSGFDVLLVNQGANVSEELKRWDVELIVLDVKMADMHGVEVLKKVREINATIPVIIFTSYPQMAGLPDFKLYKVAAVVEKGDWGRAIWEYSEAIRLDPKFATAYCNRGAAYGEKGDWDRAIADCTEAIRLDPHYVPAYYNRALTYEKKGDQTKAEADFAKAKELGYEPE